MMGIASQDKIAARFEAMLTACCLPASAIECIDDPKQRTIFRGVKAASEVPAVKNAFSIVYQDLGPVRVAGDLIFNQLKKSASLAAENVKDLDADQSLDALTAARTLFDVIDENASGRLDREELLNSPAMLALLRAGSGSSDSVAELDDAELVDAFVAATDADGDGEISFIEWARTALDPSDPALADALAKVSEQAEATASTGAKRKRQTYAQRFDEMLATCLEWEAAYAQVDADCAEEGIEPDECPTGSEEDRLRLVLMGSFQGARCEPVAAALRVCYEEYSPLRFGGDLIFRVLKRVVNGRLGRR